uniref:Solute carrier organic anion transporter family member n=1 Tax=Timema bartmani TaxID=61472 RepID=A0A7R9F062_9NEOP|nr:unnamed protein product [Timema bartmani]
MYVSNTLLLLSGILMSGNEVSQVFLSLAMSYHGGRGNRPLWISWGVTFSAISCFILALPHLVYGPGKDAIALTEEFLDTTVLNSSIPKTNDRALLCSGNKTALAYCEEDISSGEHSLMPLILIFFSQFVLGIGTTLFHSLGQTYLDDHTKKTNAPLLLGMVLSLRMLGPAAGFAFSSFCLSLYIDPTLTPVIKPTDPRWLGAWWLGWLVLGVLMLVFAFLISWFPRELPPKKKKRALNKVEKNKDRLIKTPNNTSNNKLSSESEPLNKGAVTESLNKIPIKIKKQEDDEGSASVFAMIFGFLGSGYFIGRFKPRPRLVLGWNVILGAVHDKGVYGLDQVTGKYQHCFDKSGNRSCVKGGVDSSTVLIWLETEAVSRLDVGNSCNMGCECDDLKYQPVCYREKDITFYSACHIGKCVRIFADGECENHSGKTTLSTPDRDSNLNLPVTGSLVYCESSALDHAVTKGGKKYNSLSIISFTNCTCLPFTQDTTLSSGLSSSLTTQHPLYAKDLSAVMTNGPCPVDCTRILYTYILVGFFIQALSSSGRIGNVLVNFRCVKQKDKVFAQGLSLLLVSLFAFIPGPILFGAMIVNSAVIETAPSLIFEYHPDYVHSERWLPACWLLALVASAGCWCWLTLVTLSQYKRMSADYLHADTSSSVYYAACNNNIFLLVGACNQQAGNQRSLCAYP